MHIILTGATGLVGGACLRVMLTSPTVSKISILSRRPVPQAEGHSKCEVIIHQDFESYDSAVMKKLEGAHGCIWALGIGQNKVSKRTKPPQNSDYVKITKDYSLAFARALSSRISAPCNLVWVSGEGATHQPGMFTPIFGRVKGETEKELLAHSASVGGRLPVYVVRPGAVDPQAHKDLAPFVPKFTGLEPLYRGPIVAATRRMMPALHSPSKQMAEVMVRLAGGDGKPLSGKGIEGEGRIVTNVGLRALGGLD
ncbi:MAG: hypothetical protein M1816_007296 [Peltula sp. TS41687]|nr:MAG: hypothetical protein M1816_007296 [Peltula sp. TS41687]